MHLSTRTTTLLAVLLSFTRASLCRPQIQWGPCPTQGPKAELYANASAPIECATIRVPLDYTEPNSTAQLDLPLVKVIAKKDPPKGTIQINFGGPGIGAIHDLVGDGAVYQALSGEVYDLVAFEPRGVGEELAITCAPDNVTAAVYGTLNFDFAVEPRKGWATAKVKNAYCKYVGNGNKTGEYIGTAFMARDMARIAEALDEDGMIRYWGFSYGTTLGSTIAAMFPDRVDRLVIDGIQNPHQYFRGVVDNELWKLTDKVITHFFKTCVDAGPELCALAATNKTAAEMEKDLWAFVDSVAKAPIGLASALKVVDTMMIKPIFLLATYNAAKWPELATLLVPVLYGTSSEREATLAAYFTAQSTSNVNPDANTGIHCGDRIPRLNSFEEFEPSLEVLLNTSKLQGGPNGMVQAACAQWPWKAKEIYKGDFQAKTKHPILITSNILDGQTPLASAQNVSSGFEGSVILKNNGVGHTAYSAPSICTAKYLQDYWVNGTLPPKDTTCEPEVGPWEKKTKGTWEQVLAKMAGGNSTAS